MAFTHRKYNAINDVVRLNGVRMASLRIEIRAGFILDQLFKNFHRSHKNKIERSFQINHI